MDGLPPAEASGMMACHHLGHDGLPPARAHSPPSMFTPTHTMHAPPPCLPPHTHTRKRANTPHPHFPCTPRTYTWKWLRTHPHLEVFKTPYPPNLEVVERHEPLTPLGHPRSLNVQLGQAHGLAHQGASGGG